MTEPATARTASPEATLCALLADVLGLPEVTPGQSFTGLGGDSIQAIQVVSRARLAGLVVTTRDVLHKGDVRELARTARTGGPERDRAEPATPPRRFGPVPATPIMRWLGELGGPVDTYHQSLVVRTPPGLDTAATTLVVQTLLDTHDALRLCLPYGWTSTLDAEIRQPGAVRAERLVHTVPAHGTDDADLPALTRRHLSAARGRLAPREGVLLQAVLLDRGPATQGRLALVVHHLAVDGVSWRILQDDLRACGAALAAGTAPVPDPVHTPFAHWAGLLRADATSGHRMAEAAHWARVLRPDPRPLAGLCDRPALGPAAPERTLACTLPPDVTGPLLTLAPGLVHGTVNDVLLTGLALAVLNWRRTDAAAHGTDEEGAVLVDVEGHGREDIVDGLDLSRTVGWFTTVHPVRLTLGRPDLDDARAGGPAVGAALRLVKEQLRTVPDKGVGFGLLRHLNCRTAPALTGNAEIGFNYLGRFPMGDSADWAAAPGHDFALDDADDGLPLPHAVEVNAAAHEGPDGLTLHATWTWTGNAWPERRTRELAEEWFAMLRAIARHTADPGAGGLTPSDVSLADISQDDLDAFESLFGEVL